MVSGRQVPSPGPSALPILSASPVDLTAHSPTVAAAVLGAEVSHLFWESLGRSFLKAPSDVPSCPPGKGMDDVTASEVHDLLLCPVEEEVTLGQTVALPARSMGGGRGGDGTCV